MPTAIIDINKRLSRFQKEKNNFKNIRDKMDGYDLFISDHKDKEKLYKKYKTNYDLFNGRLDIKLYDDPTCFTIQGEEVTLDYQNISHYPIISQIANAIVGEQEERPFKPMIKDNTPETMTYKKKETNNRIETYIKQNILAPQKQSIVQSLQERYGIPDLYNLAPEQQIEFANSVQTLMQQETPQEILNYMKNKYQAPAARQAQKMLDFLVEYQDVWKKQIDGFKHAVITGEEYYYQGERNGELVFEVVHPMCFDWGGSQKTERVQHGTWAKHQQWFTYEDITQRHFKDLTDKDHRDLEMFIEPLGGGSHRRFYDWENNEAQKKLMYKMSTDQGLIEKYRGLDIKTQKGQTMMKNLYADVFGKKDPGEQISGWGIKETHIVWRDKRILKKVERVEDDELNYYWVDEHYESVDADRKITKHWIDEVWEGYKIGSFDSKYVGMRPIPYQYRSLDNPNNVDLPYTGGYYNTHGNTVENCSIIDLGKTLQKDFDITMASIKHDQATDMGNMFLIYLNMIPEGMKWQDWLNTARNTGFVLGDPHKRGLNGLDPQFLKTFNAGRMGTIAQKIQLAEFFRAALGRVMYFNDVRLGAVSPYSTIKNTEANEVASHKQTALFFTQHNEIVNKSLESFLNRARMYYRDNPKQAAVFLDDISMAELLSGSINSYREMGITTSNSPQDINKLKLIKQQTLNFIQNPESLAGGIIELIYADTESEVRDIVRREGEKFKQDRQEQIKAQQQAQQAQIQGELQKEGLKQDREDKRELAKYQSQERRAVLEADKFRRANDVDRNNQNDFVEKALLDLQAKIEMHRGKMDLEREKLDLKRQVDLRNGV